MRRWQCDHTVETISHAILITSGNENPSQDIIAFEHWDAVRKLRTARRYQSFKR